MRRGSPLPPLPRQVAGGVERDPAVEADDHEGEQRLVELALAFAAGGIAQVDPDRVGDAVAVVVDVVGDLAGAGRGPGRETWPRRGRRRRTGRRIREAESAMTSRRQAPSCRQPPQSLIRDRTCALYCSVGWPPAGGTTGSSPARRRSGSPGTSSPGRRRRSPRPCPRRSGPVTNGRLNRKLAVHRVGASCPGR